MMMGPEPISRILRRSVRLGMRKSLAQRRQGAKEERKEKDTRKGGAQKAVPAPVFFALFLCVLAPWRAILGLLPGRHVLLQVAEDVQLLVEVVVADGFHLGDGLGVGPVVVLHAEDGAVRPGAVDAGEAVD